MMKATHQFIIIYNNLKCAFRVAQNQSGSRVFFRVVLCKRAERNSRLPCLFPLLKTEKLKISDGDLAGVPENALAKTDLHFKKQGRYSAPHIAKIANFGVLFFAETRSQGKISCNGFALRTRL
jgi:hypothetical protein